MSGIIRTIMLLLFGIFTVGEIAEAGLRKVPRRYYVIDFLGGYSKPVGEYNGIGGLVDLRDNQQKPIDVNASDLYDPSFHFALNYGQIRNRRMLYTIGFRFTHLDQADLNKLMLDEQNITSIVGPSWFFNNEKPSMNQYDLSFNLNFLFLDIAKRSLTPSVGLGFRAGFTSMKLKGVDSESQLDLALGVNFGAEFKLWESSRKRSFLTIASENSYEFTATGDRPRFLNIGLGIKYYFKP